MILKIPKVPSRFLLQIYYFTRFQRLTLKVGVDQKLFCLIRWIKHKNVIDLTVFLVSNSVKMVKHNLLQIHLNLKTKLFSI